MTPPLWPDLAALLQQLGTLTSPSAAAAALRTLRAQLGAAEQQDSFNEVEGKLSFQCSGSGSRIGSADSPWSAWLAGSVARLGLALEQPLEAGKVASQRPLGGPQQQRLGQAEKPPDRHRSA